jgi:hypothetical protein
MRDGKNPFVIVYVDETNICDTFLEDHIGTIATNLFGSTFSEILQGEHILDA